MNYGVLYACLLASMFGVEMGTVHVYLSEDAVEIRIVSMSAGLFIWNFKESNWVPQFHLDE